MTAISVLIGVGLGLFCTWYFFGDGLDFSNLIGEDMTFSGVIIDPIIVPIFRGVRIVQVSVVILFIGVLSSVYPAIRAAKIDISTAMKFYR